MGSYDIIVVGLLVLSVLIVFMWGKTSATHMIISGYILIICILSLYRSIDSISNYLLRTPDSVGIFLFRYESIAHVLQSGRMVIVGLVTLFLGGQMLYGSSMGVLARGTWLSRSRHALQLPLAVVVLWIAMIVIWSGKSFFLTYPSSRVMNHFSHPLIRDVLSWLPAVLGLHIIWSIGASTSFHRPFGISFNIYKKGAPRERDAIYVEHDEPVRHVVE